MKRIFGLVFVATFLWCSIVNADNGVYTWRDWRYRFTYSGCELVEYIGSDYDIHLPENINGNPVTSLAKFAFSNCSGIQSITISKSITNIDYSAFSDTRDLISINVDAGNQKYQSIDGVLFDTTTATLIHFPSAAPYTSYSVPNGTKVVGSGAFWVCINLEEIIFPDSLVSFGDAAITWCDQLIEVTIPYGVTTIGVETLSYCSQLETIYVPASVTDIGIFALGSPAANFKLIVDKGSYAEQYAIKAQKPYIYATDYISNNVQAVVSDSSYLTVSNCPELSEILSLKASYDMRYSNFADKYEGQIIEFDGRIDYITNHRSYKTRYDILVSAGNYDPNHMTGPAFQFKDVAAYDLDLDTLFLEDEIWVGRNVHIIAEVDYYDSVSELFYLIPISVTGR